MGVRGAPVWKLEWLRSWGELDSADIQRRWCSLVESSPAATVYHLPEVIEAWRGAFSDQSITPSFAFGESSKGGRVALLAVVENQRGRFSNRSILGPAGGSLFGYHDPLFADADAEEVEAFWKEVRRANRSTCDVALFRFVHRENASVSSGSSEEAPVLRMKGLSSIDELLSRCSANHRNDLRRRLRNLSAQELTLWSAHSDESAVALDDLEHRFLPAYAGIWRARPEGNMMERPATLAFVRAAVRDGVAAGWCDYARLDLDGRPIAWHIGLKFRRNFYYWIPTHDVTAESLSPGKLLLARLIERGISTGIDDFHLLTGAQQYKMAWKPEMAPLRVVRWHSPSMRGAFFAGYDRWNRRRT